MQERVKRKIFNGDDVFNENEIVLTSLELEYEAERQIRFYELQRLFLAQKAESEKTALVLPETEAKWDPDVESDNSWGFCYGKCSEGTADGFQEVIKFESA